MKNYKEMADAVFRRRDEYAAELKRKKRIALNTSLSLCALCLAAFGAIGIWKMGVVEPDPNVLVTKPPAVTESTAETQISQLSSALESNTSTTVTIHVTDASVPESETQQLSTDAAEVTVSKPQATENGDSTDPAETDPKEQSTKPTQAVTKPTKPVKPTNPTKPVTRPTVPVVTDPAETPGNQWAEPDAVVPATDVPCETEGDIAVPDEVPGGPETQAPAISATEAAPPTEEVPDATSAMDNVESYKALNIWGRVIERDGTPVKGAVMGLYKDSKLVISCVTDSQGFYFLSVENKTGTYQLKQYSAPVGFEKSTDVYTYNFIDESIDIYMEYVNYPE